MNLLMQICVVVATVGLVVMEIAVIRSLRALAQVSLEAKRVTDTVDRAAQRFDRLADAAQELLQSASDVVGPLRKASSALSLAGQRAASISTMVMDEIQPSVHTAAALSRGVRAGLSQLVARLGSRWISGDTDARGGRQSGNGNFERRRS